MSNTGNSMGIGGGGVVGGAGGGGVICGSNGAPEEITKNLIRAADRGSNTGLSDYYKTILETVRKSVVVAKFMEVMWRLKKSRET